MLYYRLLFFITVFVLLIYIIRIRNVESFYSHNKNYCGDCGKYGRYKCSQCVDCGYCITYDGYGECVPGDANGPYFRKDCYIWKYTDPIRFSLPYYHGYNHLYYNRRHPYKTFRRNRSRNKFKK